MKLTILTKEFVSSPRRSVTCINKHIKQYAQIYMQQFYECRLWKSIMLKHFSCSTSRRYSSCIQQEFDRGNRKIFFLNIGREKGKLLLLSLKWWKSKGHMLHHSHL